METFFSMLVNNWEGRFKSYYVVWKPVGCNKAVILKKMFKSYYVVWKLLPQDYASQKICCLNRTMQYGNFLFRRRYLLVLKKFKSYYVVWKLYFFRRVLKKKIDCLNRTMQYGNFSICLSADKAFNLFKSYYVVWKQNIGFERYCDFSSLNRTMQYGNHMVCSRFSYFSIRLNRTMQYGNKK